MAISQMVFRRRIILSRSIVWPLALTIFFTTSKQGEVFKGFLFLAGCMLVAVATIGRLWCSLYIGGYKKRQLVTSGPYSLCRNPLYFFSSIGIIGVGFATGTVTIPFLLAILFSLYYPFVIRFEETILAPLHGDAYKDYVARVPRFWPRRIRPCEPEEYLISPANFRRTMFDALWFMWLVGLIHLAEAIRNAGILPTIIKFY